MQISISQRVRKYQGFCLKTYPQNRFFIHMKALLRPNILINNELTLFYSTSILWTTLTPDFSYPLNYSDFDEI